jgi:hypothetical protein
MTAFFNGFMEAPVSSMAKMIGFFEASWTIGSGPL